VEKSRQKIRDNLRHTVYENQLSDARVVLPEEPDADIVAEVAADAIGK
jgi:hypothetical protein